MNIKTFKADLSLIHIPYLQNEPFMIFYAHAMSCQKYIVFMHSCITECELITN